MTMPEQTRPIRHSGVRYDRPVGKRIEKDPDGPGLKKVACLEARASAGQLLNEAFTSAREAFEFRRAADARTMFLSGTFPEECTASRVVPAGALEGPELSLVAVDAEDFAAANGAYLAFREGRGIMSVDVDPCKHPEAYPGPQAPFGSADEVRRALLELLPEAEAAPMLVMASSSSMIEDVDTGELVTGPGGWRILIVVSDAREIPRLLKTIHWRAWARNRYCYAYPSRSGRVLARSLADQALARPTQPDYPCADLGPGLRKADVAEMYNVEGQDLDPGKVLLGPEDERLAGQNIAQAKTALRPASSKCYRRAVAEHVKILERDGVGNEPAQRAAERLLRHRILLGSNYLEFATGQRVQVGELLGPSGRDYDEQLCLDPIEPGYDGGRVVAKFYLNGGSRPAVYSFAHGEYVLRLRHDAISAASAIETAAGAKDEIVRAVALADVSDIELDQLEAQACKALRLGRKVKSFRAEVRGYRARYGLDAEKLCGDDQADPAAPLPLDQALEVSGFPHIRQTAGGVLFPIAHLRNIAHLLDSYGFDYRYDEVGKEIVWSHPACPAEGDNRDNLLYARVASLCNLNKMPTSDLGAYLTAVAEEHSFNPVVDYLSALKWDGRPRFDKLAQEISPLEPEIAKITTRLFLIGACAAADHASEARKLSSRARPSFEYVLVLVGAQGAGKTKGLGRLLPQPLQRYYKQGVVLDPRDKDSVKPAVSAWITELGELDATFRKADIEQLKAFTSREVDELRMPYARMSSKFLRRTLFVGTVNDEAFLADRTGNRRFLPLKVGRIDIDWPDDEIDQLWAEAWARYVQGGIWWPTADEGKMLAVHSDQFRATSWIEDAIERYFDWDFTDTSRLARRSASDIYAWIAGGDAGAHRANQGALKEIAACLKRQWQRRGDVVLEDGEHYLVTAEGRHRLHNAGGKQNGWLLPPSPGMANVVALAATAAPAAKAAR